MNLETAQKIYVQMPVFMQNLAISLYGTFWKNHRFGGVYKTRLREIKNREFYTFKEWDKYQTACLRKLLVHAYDTVPFYQKRYKASGIDRDFLANIELKELKFLPCTTKEDFRKFGAKEMLSTKLSRGKFECSSGSTGTPVSIYKPDYMVQTGTAFMEARVLNWAGVSYNQPRGMIGGRRILPESSMVPPFYRYNFAEKQTYFSAYHISDKTVDNYLKGMIENNVQWLTGYAMSNFFVANLLREKQLSAPKMKAVITSSEKLTKEMREVLQEVYTCKVYDSYSGSEFCGLISETSEGELIVSPDVGIMEFLDDSGNSVSNGEIGEIVSTGFLNFDQPLIRYRIGDMARVSFNQNLKTKHQMVKIEEIIGRVEDVIITKDGRKMVRFHTVFTDIEGLQASQVIQKTYEEFVIKLIVDAQFYDKTAAEDKMCKTMKSQLGEISISFEYVKDLPKNSNGKVKAVISEINKHL